VNLPGRDAAFKKQRSINRKLSCEKSPFHHKSVGLTGGHPNLSVVISSTGTNRRIGRNQRRTLAVLNKFGPSGHGEAKLQFLDGDFRVVSPGTFVRCAVTDVRIPLDELRYWSVDLQEAYATPGAVLQRHFPGTLKKA
jgi:hypothetical protein